MSIIKSSADHITINADGAGKNILFQANGVQVASISSDGDLACNSVATTETVVGIAGETISAGELVFFFTDGKVMLGDNRELGKSILSGFATNDAVLDGAVTIQSSGSLDEFTGLTIGTQYFLGNTAELIVKGSIATSEYIVSAGVAISATELDVSIGLPEPTVNQGSQLAIGDFLQAATSGDRSAEGLKQIAFDNAISTANFPILWEKIGHKYNAQHFAAGDTDLSSQALLFYPTPIPGAYNRSGIPDISVSGTTATLPTGFRNGTLFLVKSGTDQAAGTELFVRRTGASTVTYHSSEAGAIANTGAITVTGVGILTQEGIYLDDAMKGWQAGGLDVTNKFGFLAGNGYLSQAIIQTNHSLPYFSTTGQGSAAKITAVSDTVNGPVNPTNETRPKTSITFGYIKAEHVTTSGEPISALRYDTGWINRSDWTNVHLGSDITKNTDSNVTHGLSANLSDLIVDVLVSTDGTSEATLEANSFSVGGIAAGTSQGRGYEVRQVDTNNLEIQTGNAGMYFLDTNGNGAGIDTESWFYKVVVTKPNLVATAFDVSNMPKTYDLTSADVTVTLPAISGVLQTKSIYWTNGGTYKLSLSSSETVGGLAALTWEGEGEGHMLLESDGTNWQVREYEDTGSDFIKHADGWADVWGNAFSSTTTSSPNKFGTTSGNAYYGDGTFTYPFTAASAPSRDNIILSLVDGTSLAVYLSASTITTTQINNIRTWSNVVSTAVKVSVNVKLRWRT